MANQIVVSAGAKVRNLQDVIIGTSGVLSSLGFDVANGVPKLDSNGKILVSQLPNSVMEYKGTWSAATNTPTLANGTGNQGDVYLCNVAGTVDFGAGPIAFFVGDQVIYSGSIWQRASGASGTVTSVAVTESGDSLNITGSPITTSGTINIGFNGTNLQYVNGAGNLTTFPTLITSIGLSMPSAFSVANSPLTANGTIAVTGAGVASQYIRGDGTLADFPSSGGGGSSVSYYLNGGTSQGTIGGTTYYEMSKTAVIGTGVDFTKSGDGFIVAFLTDANDPEQLNIPAGNWNYEIYASMSSNGGTPEMYAELYKYDGTTFTLIATSSNEIIYDGTALNLYTFAMAVPATTLALTDRLAVKLYATNSGGKTTTIHTQDGHLCQVITTFSTGITALNGLTAQVQYFQTGTSGTDFNISSATATHTFNLPTASASNRGALSSSDWSVFNGKQAALNGTGFVKISGTTISYDNSTYLTTAAASTTYLPMILSATAKTVDINGQQFNIYGTASSYTSGRIVVDPLFACVGYQISGVFDGLLISTDGSALFSNSGITRFMNQVRFDSTLTNGTYTYTLPSATGTIALVGGSGVGTVTSVAALTIGTSGTDLSSSVATGTTTPVITLNVPTASAANRGALSSADWTTFNNKQSALTNPVLASGTWTSGYLPKINGTYTIGNSIISESGSEINVAGILKANGAGALLQLLGGGTSTQYQKWATDGGNFFIGVSSSTGTGLLNSQNPYSFCLVTESARDMSFGTSNSTKMTIFSDGNVGINTGNTNAGYKLDVNGTGRFSGVLTVTNASGVPASVTSTAATSTFVLDNTNANLWGGVYAVRVNGVDKNYFGTLGSLLGTSNTDATIWATSGNGFRVYTNGNNKQLEITTTGAATFSSSVTAGGGFISNNDSNTPVGFYKLKPSSVTTARWWRITSDNVVYGDFSIAQSSANSDASYTNILYFNAAGAATFSSSVGIGGATPSALLHVGSGGGAGATNSIAYLGGYSTGVSQLRYIMNHNGAANAGIGTPSAGGILFGYGAVDGTITGEWMRITTGGNVLIGTTDDGGRLVSYTTTAATQIKAAGTAPAISFSNTVLSPTIGGVLGAATGANQFLTGTAAGDMILINQFTGNKLYITNYSGGVYLTQGATSWTANSDIRLKNINSHIENAVEKLSTLQTINFSYKDDKTNKQNLGLIAQEVEKIFPELIDKNGDGMLGVRYTELVPVLIKAVQELKLEIETLKNK